jgi:hypothetical protein
MMIERERERCAELARLLLGAKMPKKLLDELVEKSDSFEEFRILLVLESEAGTPEAKAVADHWRERVRERRTRSDGNDLMHTAELLALKHDELQQKLTQATADMLEKLRAIDTLATVQADIRERLSEIGDLVEEFRERARRAEATPAARPAGDKP